MINQEKLSILRSKGYTYLGHVTTKTNFEALYASYFKNPLQKIGTAYERYLEKVQVNGVYSYTTLDFDSPFSIPNPCDYPALFFHLCHQSFEELIERYSNSGSVLLLFPLELLLQRNWHYKIMDKNGLIDYDTYFPENMDTIPSYQEISDYYRSIGSYYIGNEVVFHDGTYFSNAICAIGKELNIMINSLNKYKIDDERLPNYVFYSDRRYDGSKFKYFNPSHRDEDTTSTEFYVNFMKAHLPEKYKYLCENVSSKEELEQRIFETKVKDMDLFSYLYVYRNVD
jgi:hypothetical protein